MVKKGARLECDSGLAERASLYVEKLFGIQRYSSLLSGGNKNPRRKVSAKSFVNPPLQLPGRSFPCAILQPCGRRNKLSVRTGAAVSGHRNRSVILFILRQE